MMVGEFVAVAIVAYLLGAIPFGLIVGKLMGRVDITKYGSGKTGVTNVLRTTGTKAGILVAVLDLAKAIGAVMLAKVIVGDSVLLVAGFPLQWQVAQIVAALMTMVGHNWSVFIKFRGGRGVATYFGGWLAIYPATALFGGGILLLTAFLTRYMSLGSILGVLGIWCLLVPLTIVYHFPPIYLVYALAAAVLIIYQHRDNIIRLQAGTELKLGDKNQKLDL